VGERNAAGAWEKGVIRSTRSLCAAVPAGVLAKCIPAKGASMAAPPSHTLPGAFVHSPARCRHQWCG
jgi:hypothetical protein